VFPASRVVVLKSNGHFMNLEDPTFFKTSVPFNLLVNIGSHLKMGRIERSNGNFRGLGNHPR
jgi:hypothetical protein